MEIVIKVISTQIDDEDYEFFSQHKWCLNSTGYLQSWDNKKRGMKRDSFHRIIMKAPKGTYIDHINGDKLDNRKANLRFCTNQENSGNAGKSKRNTSGYKGVTWDKNRNKYMSCIGINKVTFNLGRFTCPIEAAKAYDAVAREWFGKFARTNFDNA